MKKKLTLRLDDSLIKQAKKYARKKGTSVSKMVADYFSALEAGTDVTQQQLSPKTVSLIGILKDSGVEESDYKNYLEEKYLK